MNSQIFHGSLDIDINNYQDVKGVFLSLTEKQKEDYLTMVNLLFLR